jgi:hypothetical protein
MKDKRDVYKNLRGKPLESGQLKDIKIDVWTGPRSFWPWSRGSISRVVNPCRQSHNQSLHWLNCPKSVKAERQSSDRISCSTCRIDISPPPPPIWAHYSRTRSSYVLILLLLESPEKIAYCSDTPIVPSKFVMQPTTLYPAAGKPMIIPFQSSGDWCRLECNYGYINHCTENHASQVTILLREIL